MANYRINSFYVIIDTAVATIKERFDFLNNKFYADISLLDPRNLNEIKTKGLKSPVFEALSEKLIAFDLSATAENLRSELFNLSLQWENIKSSPLDEYDNYHIFFL